ncbi:hypothetical protein QAD02_017049 [Eretmocerus hayati]|uniref:Uncharacterized protein n=1 Tax=Eretmocerus hayati TaxID=131215 RepID=A0ACC2PD65_9HYME|nr:hypothetical protein QAD02_017049 [Eretmocerus hayati]
MEISHKFLVVLLSFLAASTSVRGGCTNLSWRTRSHLDSMGIKIPDDYCYIKDIGVYKLHTDLANWNEAREICKKEGAHLAILNSRREAELLGDMFKNSDLKNKGPQQGNGVFIGFHDLYQEGKFVTIFDDLLEETGYNTWSRQWGGQPDNGQKVGLVIEAQNCGALAFDSELDDVNCSWKLGFICEIPMRPLVLSEISKSYSKKLYDQNKDMQSSCNGNNKSRSRDY